jgi:hypothetical protein
MSFQFTRDFKLAYARSIDIADYYRRHFEVTPRTVFVSKTDHIQYDKWWQCHWLDEGRLVTREQIPWGTRISTIMADRQAAEDGALPYSYKDPMSYELIVVEDQNRSIRFERTCPNPIWWFDYTVQETAITRETAGLEASWITHTKTPDVYIVRHDSVSDDQLTITLKMKTDAEFKDYAIALWALPNGFDPQPSRIETNATECIAAYNSEGENHLVLFFDLEPDFELRVTLRKK